MTVDMETIDSGSGSVVMTPRQLFFIVVKLSIVDVCGGHGYASGYPSKIRPLDFGFLANVLKYWLLEKISESHFQTEYF